MGHRLESAALKLEWQMADTPPLPCLEPALALQALRLIQKAMISVIKHAQARTLSLSARQEGDALEVRIEDDDPGCNAARGERPREGTRVSPQLPLRPASAGGLE
ncbi:hypothetical protein [Roseateles sp. P5_E7]